MKKKGFTLAELLVSLALLALLVLISIPVLIKVFENEKQKNYDLQIMYVEKAASMFASDNKHLITELGEANMPYTITINDLSERDYLQLPIINPLTDNNIDPLKSTVVITRIDESTFTYEVSFIE